MFTRRFGRLTPGLSRPTRARVCQLESLESRTLLTATALTPLTWVQQSAGDQATVAAYFITTSPDGTAVFTTSTDSNKLAVYSVDPATGGLNSTPRQVVTNGAAGVANLVRPHSLAISPDSKFVYVAAQGSGTSASVASSLKTFKLNLGDSGSPLADVPAWNIVDTSAHPEGIFGAAEIRIASNPWSTSANDRLGRFVYVTARDGGNIAIYQRNLDSSSGDFGRLSLVGTTGTQDYLDGARGLAISPDLRHVYATGRNSNSIAVFDRNPTTGLLTLNEVWADTSTTLAVVPAQRKIPNLITATNIVVSPDGTSVYVASGGTFVTGGGGEPWERWDQSYLDSSLTVFARNAGTGKLTYQDQFLDGQARPGGVTVDGLRAAINLAVSPDGSRVLVTGHADGVGTSIQDSGALAQFERAANGSLTFISAERYGGLQAAAGRGGAITDIKTANIPAAGPRPQVTGASGSLSVNRGDWLAISQPGSSPFNGTRRVDGVQSKNNPVKYSLAAATSTTTWSGGTATWLQSKMRGALGVVVSPNSKYVYTANYGTPANIGPFGSDLGIDGSVAAFALNGDSTGPRIQGVRLRNPGFPASYDYYVPVGSGEQIRSLPLGGVTQVMLKFDQPVSAATVGIDDLKLVDTRSSAVLTPSSVDVSDDKFFTVTWTFAAAVGTGQWKITLDPGVTTPVRDAAGNLFDGEWTNPAQLSQTTGKLFPSGNGTPGGIFEFGITVLAGDADRDNNVGAGDYALWAAQFGQTGPGWSADFNGDGSVGSGDYALWAANFGKVWTDFPGGSLLMAPGGGGSAGSAATGPEAARKAVLALYTSGQRDWQTDAVVILGWGEKNFAAAGAINDFLFSLSAWLDQLES